MVSLVWLTAAVLFGLYVFNYYRCYARNLAAAEKSGLPYVVLPIYTFNRFWLVTHKLWIPFLEKLPASWTSPWLQFLDPEWVWLKKHEPFELLGSDTFILCSPGHNSLMVADPEAVTQIVTRRNDFPKPIELYGSVDLFGKNVVSTEGSIWRHHRKITSPPFTEKNNHMVWLESLHQAKSMMTAWMGKADGQEKPQKTTVADVAAATMRLSLHVISRAGFGVQLLWPHEEEEKGVSGELPKGHTMTYKDALSTLLENILAVMLIPRWFLAYAPFKSTQVAYESFVEWGKYMKEMHQEKKAEVRAGEKQREGMDLMGALVLNGEGEKQLLTDSEVLGNAFVFILAGHETVANTLHFSMLYLAMNWSSQSRLHKDLDEIFGDRPVEEWDYERDVPKLFGSMAGAVMNEELRLIPPVIGIPKCTLKDSPQPMSVSGRRVIVPASCHITLDTVASHRNPKHWPTLCGPGASPSDIKADLDSFKPERWLLDPSKAPPSPNTSRQTPAAATSDSEPDPDIGGPESRDTSSQLFHPVRGAYIPFSEGYRACLGRRFAQVEVLAVLASVFKHYSVELALDEYADDAEIAAMTDELRRQTWGSARDKAQELLRSGMGTIITIQMRKGRVPLRFVKRGTERFRYD